MNHIPPIRNMETISIFSKNFAPPPLISYHPYFNSIFPQTCETPYNHGNSYTFTQNCCIITETHIQTRKLRAVSVFVLYPPFIDSIFRQANTPFTQNQQYPTPFYLSALYYHGTPRLLRESILLPDSTIFSPIAILSAAHKTRKSGVHHPP